MICPFYFTVLFYINDNNEAGKVNKMINLSSCATQLTMINFWKQVKKHATEGWVHSVVKLFSVVLTLFTILEACTNMETLIWQPVQGGDDAC